ncbi:MAG: type II secretion system protein [Planctomycetota bacterium]
MKKKGFTLVELLVVIAIIALLMGILMPALARVRQVAYRMVCGTNLSGIGKGMLIYANDNNEAYPIGGVKNDTWTTFGTLDDFEEPYLKDAVGTRGGVTITHSLFLLIRNADLQPKQFNCKGDTTAKIFKVSDEADDPTLDPTEVWDFGSFKQGDMSSSPGEYNSYCYHMPYEFPDPDPASLQSTNVSRPVSAVSHPGAALCADRNPYFDISAMEYLDGRWGADPPRWIEEDRPNRTLAHYVDTDKTGNSALHQREGQNVLFADIHVSFERYPNVGIDHDNIWKPWGYARPSQRQKQLGEFTSPDGKIQRNGSLLFVPWSQKDSVLVSETNEKIQQGGGGRGGGG